MSIDELLSELKTRWTILHQQCPECLPEKYINALQELNYEHQLGEEIRKYSREMVVDALTIVKAMNYGVYAKIDGKKVKYSGDSLTFNKNGIITSDGKFLQYEWIDFDWSLEEGGFANE